jgi:hypothetical protein
MIFVDESGDHSLTSIDEQYPIFVLTLCIVEKSAYSRQIVPAFTDFKMEFFGHDLPILHAHEIRKPRGDFTILLNPHTRARFMERLNGLIEATPMTIVGVVIRKTHLKARYAEPKSPYDLALRFGLERAFRFPWDKKQQGKVVPFVAESRGRKEDADFELQFRRITQNSHEWELPFFKLAMGQIAFDRKILNPEQSNRAYDLLASKLLTSEKGGVDGWGLKVFP